MNGDPYNHDMGDKILRANLERFKPVFGEDHRASTRKLAAHDPAVSEALDLIRREACSGLAAARVLGRFPCSRRQAKMRFRKATGHSVLDEIHDV